MTKPLLRERCAGVANVKCHHCGKSHRDDTMVRRKPRIWETNPPTRAMKPIWVCPLCDKAAERIEATTQARWFGYWDSLKKESNESIKIPAD